ncbi:MAG: 30S ribosomal protein S20 [Alphaproteobacteria bacterium]|nr:30S ribosomal protein S20 [Alphaproteobacteria bacterium]
MAYHKSAQKRIRRNARRARINGARVNRMRSFLRKVASAIEAGDRAGAERALREAEPVVASGAAKGVLRKNAAARRIARLSARVRGLSSTPTV